MLFVEYPKDRSKDMKEEKTVILVVEDDPAIREGLVDALLSEDYAVKAASNGKIALDLLKNETIHLLILDLMMPEMSGYDVCRSVRKSDSQLPILMLTAKGEEIDKVLGLELGADDYMTKPFGIRELLARVHALLRRSHPKDENGPHQKDSFAFGPFTIDPKTFTAARETEILPLSARELKLLQIFVARPDEVLSRDELLNEAWGIDYYGTTRTLDQHIAQLRKKVEPDLSSGPQLILTVHGIGYRYQPPSE
jgi:DNA-binding response OmpR family regulator